MLCGVQVAGDTAAMERLVRVGFIAYFENLLNAFMQELAFSHDQAPPPLSLSPHPGS